MKTYKYKVKGVDYEVEIAEVEGNVAKVNVNGIPFELLLLPATISPSFTMTAPKGPPPRRTLSSARRMASRMNLLS